MVDLRNSCKILPVKHNKRAQLSGRNLRLRFRQCCKTFLKFSFSKDWTLKMILDQWLRDRRQLHQDYCGKAPRTILLAFQLQLFINSWYSFYKYFLFLGIFYFTEHSLIYYFEPKLGPFLKTTVMWWKFSNKRLWSATMLILRNNSNPCSSILRPCMQNWSIILHRFFVFVKWIKKANIK